MDTFTSHDMVTLKFMVPKPINIRDGEDEKELENARRHFNDNIQKAMSEYADKTKSFTHRFTLENNDGKPIMSDE